ncbi:hypothetical protein SCARD494_11218 [Seiridium cardinale]
MARLPGNSATISQPGRTSRSVYSVQNAAAIEYQEYNKENGNETCEDPSNSTRATPAQPNLSDDNLDDAFGPKTSNTSDRGHEIVQSSTHWLYGAGAQFDISKGGRTGGLSARMGDQHHGH